MKFKIRSLFRSKLYHIYYSSCSGVSCTFFSWMVGAGCFSRLNTGQGELRIWSRKMIPIFIRSKMDICQANQEVLWLQWVQESLPQKLNFLLIVTVVISNACFLKYCGRQGMKYVKKENVEWEALVKYFKGSWTFRGLQGMFSLMYMC